jgi:HSP20 family protein
MDLMGMGEEMSRLFDVALDRGALDCSSLFDSEWAPSVDVYENEKMIVVKTELPGMAQGDIDVDIMGDTLTIKGEKKKEAEQKDRHYHKLERVYGSFHRSVTLPSEVVPEKAKASFKNGVLEIEAPKKKAAKPKQIKVNVG